MPVSEAPGRYGLKGRQLECMLLAKQGLSSKLIARELGISHRTVEVHLAAAIRNLGVSTRMEAIALLYQLDAEEARQEDAGPFMLAGAAEGDELVVADAPERQEAPHIFPPLGGSTNRASRKVRIAWMVRVAIFCTMLTCAAILTVMGLSQLAGERP